MYMKVATVEGIRVNSGTSLLQTHNTIALWGYRVCFTLHRETEEVVSMSEQVFHHDCWSTNYCSKLSTIIINKNKNNYFMRSDINKGQNRRTIQKGTNQTDQKYM